MADNVTVTPGAGASIATDDVGGVQYQIVKLADGTLDSSTKSKITTSAAGASDPGLVVRDAGQIATIGALTETAPTTDTASSGLNGRLQRIAQRLTSLQTAATPYHLRSAGTTNATSLKASAGVVYGITATNHHATLPRYLKFYDKASAPNPAADTVVKMIAIPPTDGGTNIPISSRGVNFAVGIAFAIVDGEDNTNNVAITAGDVHVNIDWI